MDIFNYKSIFMELVKTKLKVIDLLLSDPNYLHKRRKWLKSGTLLICILKRNLQVI